MRVVKGIIMNLFEQVTVEAHGAMLWDDLLQSTGMSGAYTALGNYPDSDLVSLVCALADRTGRDVPAVLRWFGADAIPLMAARYPWFFEPETPVEFVVSVNEIIHSEVVKLYPGATPPLLVSSDVTPHSVTVDYRSSRALSDLAVGFLEGTAAWFATTVSIDRQLLADDGTEVRLHCTFASAGASGGASRRASPTGGTS